MARIEQKYMINGRADDIWDALTDPKRIQVWSDSRGTFDARPGGEFSYYDGDVRGRVLEADPWNRLVLAWQPADWSTLDSTVSITLTPVQGGTQVDIVHDNVEESDYDRTAEDWDVHYLGAVKKEIEGNLLGLADTSKRPAAARNAAPRRRNAPTPKRTATGGKGTAKRPASARKSNPAKKKATKKSTRKTGTRSR